MVALSHLAAALAAIAPSLASPTEPEAAEAAPVSKRGDFNFVMGPDHPLARRAGLKPRSSTNYNQDYTTGGTVGFYPASGEFYVDWDTTDDFVVGVGWNPGSTEYGSFLFLLSSLPSLLLSLPIGFKVTNVIFVRPITHGGSFDVTSGLASLSVYGWTTNPLVEYYIMEYADGTGGAGTEKGSVTSDGVTYTIWENTRYDEPSIEGTSTFNQYISVANSPRVSGTVTVENHFQAWADHGMDLGTLNFQVIAVESWDGSGNAWQQVSN